MTAPGLNPISTYIQENGGLDRKVTCSRSLISKNQSWDLNSDLTPDLELFQYLISDNRWVEFIMHI